MSGFTLSAASNPWGTPNPDGIYYLKIPDTVGTITIGASRLKGTILLEAGGSGQKLVLSGAQLWEPSGSGFATMITKGFSTITVTGSSSAYSDGSLSELRGVFHTINTPDVTLDDGTMIRGCWIADGLVTLKNTTAVTATPSLYTNPPLGYCKGNKLYPTLGTYKWDAPPSGS
jgi:hypothetical protein